MKNIKKSLSFTCLALCLTSAFLAGCGDDKKATDGTNQSE